MKLVDYLPDVQNSPMAQRMEYNDILNNTLELIQKSANTRDAVREVSRPSSIGLNAGFGAPWYNTEWARRQYLTGQVMEIAKNVQEVRSCIFHIINEVFRRGMVWKPAYASKCSLCGTEYPEDVEQCIHCFGEKKEEGEDKLGSLQGMGNTPDGPNVTPPQQQQMPMGKQVPQLPEKPNVPDLPLQTGNDAEEKRKDTLIKPDVREKNKMMAFLDNCNIWNQSLEEVLRSGWFDINATDDIFIYIEKEYILMEEKNHVRSRPTGIRRLEPGLVEWDLDIDGLPKNNHFMCYVHREETISQKPGECSECGNDLIPVMYRYLYHGVYKYFFESEIIHESKFFHSETYGYSPILTIMSKVLTIRGMDMMLYRYFFERKMPSSLLLVSTDDSEGLKRERANINAEVRKDPAYVPIVAVSTKNGRGRVDMVRLFHTLQEMDYLPVREEIRQRISAMWGVTPVWESGNDSASGLSLQSQQLVVMSRVVESDQRLIQEKILPKILDAFGINGWILELQQPEEKAEVTRISFASQRISAANMLVSMGFTVDLSSSEVGLDDINFKISGSATSMQDQMMGMGGGGATAGGNMGSSMPSPNEQMPMGDGSDLEMPQMPPTPEEKNNNKEDIQKSFNILKQMAGNNILKIADDNSYILYELDDKLHKAIFNKFGEIEEIEKMESPRMHRHEGQWTYHDINIQHNETDSRQNSMDTALWQPELPDNGELNMNEEKDGFNKNIIV